MRTPGSNIEYIAQFAIDFNEKYENVLYLVIFRVISMTNINLHPSPNSNPYPNPNQRFICHVLTVTD